MPDEAVESTERFPPTVVRDLLLQLGGALAEAHAKGVVHRDLKPANILVDTSGLRPRYVLTDFGVGGAETGIRSEKLLAGTYLFMAPEQRRWIDRRVATMGGLAAVWLLTASGIGFIGWSVIRPHLERPGPGSPGPGPAPAQIPPLRPVP